MAAADLGHGIVPTTSPHPLSTLAIDFSTTGANTVISATAGQTIRVFKIFFVANAQTDITIKDGSTALTGAMSMGANGGFTLDYDKIAWFVTSAGAAFVLSQSGTAQVSGRVYYQKS